MTVFEEVPPIDGEGFTALFILPKTNCDLPASLIRLQRAVKEESKMDASNESVGSCASKPELRNGYGCQAAEYEELEGQELIDSLQRRSTQNPRTKELSPKVLKLGSITIIEDLFQLRTMLPFQSQSQVRTLMKTPKEGRPLAPLLVWWAGDKWLLLDGHHRVKAYKAALWGDEVEVPVECFVGLLGDAMLQAAATNCRPVLQMDRKERMTAAWRLTMRLKKSKAELASAAAVSTSTISNMRGVLRRLQARDLDEFPIPTEWGVAFMQDRGMPMEDINWEEKEEGIVNEMAAALSKTFGKVPNHKKPLLARALDRFDSQITDEVILSIGLDRLKELYEKAVYDDENAAF